MKKMLAASGRLRAAGLAVLLGLSSTSPSADAAVVDAELILLVDLTEDMSDGEFDQLMESYAQTFESAGMIDAIQAGTTGSLAVSLVFYTDRNKQEVGVDWLAISDVNSAASFAQALRDIDRPLDEKKASIAGGIDFSVPLFGDETGSAGNGFESARQALFLTGHKIDDHTKPAGGLSREEMVAASRDAALSAGVDVIGAMTVGEPGDVDAYFASNVIGGQVGGFPGGVTNADDTYAQLFPLVEPTLIQFVDALSPEPGFATLALVAAAFLSRRRRRDSLIES